MDTRSLVVGILIGVLIGYVLAPFIPPTFRVKGRIAATPTPARTAAQPGLGVTLGRPGHRGVVTTTTTHLALAVKLPESTVHLNDDEAKVEVGGATYHRLADVPTEAKMRLVEELGLALDSGTLPEPARTAIEAFLAGQGPAPAEPAAKV